MRDPSGSFFGVFTKSSAWELVVQKLEEGQPVETVSLRKPPRRVGYVLKLELDGAPGMLYVKLELSRSRSVVYGRSFHYS